MAAAAACALWAMAGTAWAQTANPPSSGWDFEIQPYLWVPKLKADVRINDLPEAKVDMSARDVVNDLKFGLMGMVEARNGRWGLVADGFYAKLADSGGANFALRPRGPGFDVDAKLTMKQYIMSLAGEYRALEGSTPVDVMAGGRYNKIDMEAKVDITGLGRLGLTAGRNLRYKNDWVDPYVGVRVVHPIADKWSILGYADVGGFGIGSSSKSTNLLIGGLNYGYSKTTTLKFGYRYYRVNYNRGSFKMDSDEGGLYFAAGFKF
jgi:opacity protein-like surface antigen